MTSCCVLQEPWASPSGIHALREALISVSGESPRSGRAKQWTSSVATSEKTHKDKREGVACGTPPEGKPLEPLKLLVGC